jgi:hypothetical protein
LNKIDKGLLFLEVAQRVLARDFTAAFEDKDWNIAVRRAQEAAEYAVKALYLLAGQDPPQLHEPPFRKLLSQVRLWRGNTLDLKDVSFFADLNSKGHDIVLYRIENGVHTQLASATGLGIDPSKAGVFSVEPISKLLTA